MADKNCGPMYCKNNQSQTDNKIKKKGYLIKKLSLIWGGRKNKNKELKKKQRLAICSHHEAISQCRRDNSSENSRLQIAQPFWHSSCFSNIRFNLTLTCRPILLVQSNKSTYYFQCESIATVTTYQYIGLLSHNSFVLFEKSSQHIRLLG